jgi:branched-chain amino acid transport system substrate-binding protein
MRRWSLFLSLFVGVLLAASCTSPNSDAPPGPASPVGEVRIGLLTPLSGASKAGGVDAGHGADLAAAVINGEVGRVPLAGVGGAGLPRLGGAKLKIVRADTRSDVAVGSTTAASLVTQEHVVGVVGAYDADVTAAASQRTERLRVPFVNGDASADFLTERGLDWFFRVGPTDRRLGEDIFSALRQLQAKDSTIKTEQVGVVFADDAPTNGALASTMELIGEGGGFRVVAQEPFPSGGDPADAVKRVQAKAPDTVFLVASRSEDAGRAVEAVRELGYRPPGMFTFGAGFLDPAGLKTIERDGEGLFYSSVWSEDVAVRNPAAKPLMDIYQQRYQVPMNEVAASSFTAVLTLAAAVDSAGSLDPERVRTALLGLDVSGRDTIMPWDGVRFDASHQNARSTGVVEQLIQGEFRVVFPSELVEGPGAVWPLPSPGPG